MCDVGTFAWPFKPKQDDGQTTAFILLLQRQIAILASHTLRQDENLSSIANPAIMISAQTGLGCAWPLDSRVILP
jgi:hypothetical protein